MNKPKVSCYCATYGRPHVLEEALESFLRQNYTGDKELIILNDFKENTLSYDHPQVKIYNVKEHIMPLGKKFNETVKLCSGDILMPWEDDDIYLPNRISYTVDHMENGFFHVGFAYLDLPGNKLQLSGNHFHCNMAVEKSLWDKVGGYSEIDNCTLDVELMARLKKEANFKIPNFDFKDIFYIYRWGTTGSYHASGWGSSDGVSVSNNVKKMMSSNDIVGDYYLQPFWKYDYEAVARGVP